MATRVGMQQKQLREAMTILLREVPTWDVPVVSLIAQESHNPYRVLISTLLSLRTLDQTTGPAAQRSMHPARFTRTLPGPDSPCDLTCALQRS